jgi:hypothetical protein
MEQTSKEKLKMHAEKMSIRNPGSVVQESKTLLAEFLTGICFF